MKLNLIQNIDSQTKCFDRVKWTNKPWFWWCIYKHTWHSSGTCSWSTCDRSPHWWIWSSCICRIRCRCQWSRSAACTPAQCPWSSDIDGSDAAALATAANATSISTRWSGNLPRPWTHYHSNCWFFLACQSVPIIFIEPLVGYLFNLDLPWRQSPAGHDGGGLFDPLPLEYSLDYFALLFAEVAEIGRLLLGAVLYEFGLLGRRGGQLVVVVVVRQGYDAWRLRIHGWGEPLRRSIERLRAGSNCWQWEINFALPLI